MSGTRFAASGGAEIAYELRGWARTRRPALVLIQGLGFDRTGWGPALGLLQRRFRLVLIDNRGTGASGTLPGPLSVADMRRDVVAVLDDAGVDVAHVLGASLGGMIAQDLAVCHPERVDRLVLACTTPGWPFAYPMPGPFMRLLGACRRLPAETASRRLIEAALAPATLAAHPELVDRILAHRASVTHDPDRWSAQAAAGARYIGSLRQRRITAKTLILHGAADIVVDPRNARLLADRIPDAELAVLPAKGHLFFWEDPDAFAATAVGFLLDRSSMSSAT